MGAIDKAKEILSDGVKVFLQVLPRRPRAPPAERRAEVTSTTKDDSSSTRDKAAA